jgi:endoglucanase
MYVMIEPHGASSDNFAKYKGNFVGSSAVPNSAFADLWSRLAMQFKGNPYVVYGLSNEPNGMSTVQWFQAAQAAIVAIRDAGSTGLILVPGNGWTGASSWTQNWYDTATTKVSNAQAYLKYINDPLGNTAVSVHNYFDADASGGATSVVSSTIGSERLKVVVDWAKANGVKVHVSEFATPNSSAGQTTLNDFLNYVNANSSTVIGWAWWAYGPPTWWGGYQFTLDPSKNYTVDSYAMPWLSSNLVSPVLPVVDAGSDSGSTGGLDSGLVDAGQKVDAGSADAGVVSVASIRPATSTVANPGDQGFTSTKTVTASSGVPAGTYTLKVETRTQYSDNNTFCVTFILNNTNSTVDVDWSSMTVDLRGHTLQSSWNAVVVGNSGVITVTPNASSKTVLAGDRNSFGMCLNRQADKTKAHYQVLVKTLVW